MILVYVMMLLYSCCILDILAVVYLLLYTLYIEVDRGNKMSGFDF